MVHSTFFLERISTNTVIKSQKDHVILEKWQKSCISNARSYRGTDGETDHYLVVIDFSEKLSVSWRMKQQQKMSQNSSTGLKLLIKNNYIGIKSKFIMSCKSPKTEVE
jgi:hypothetical protein